MSSVTESLVPAASSELRVQVSVATVQVQLPEESVMAVTVNSGGSAKLNVTELSIAVVVLVLVTVTASWSAESPDPTLSGLGLKTMLSEGTTTGCTKADRSKSAYSSIFSCADMAPEFGGHSAGKIVP